jgi:hypothetical protein
MIDMDYNKTGKIYASVLANLMSIQVKTMANNNINNLFY